MKTTIPQFRWTVMALLLTGFLWAQPYDWQWAKAGGGDNRLVGEVSYYDDYNYCEEIVGLKTDTENNTFFLTHIAFGNTAFDGTEITTFNSNNFGNSNRQNILIGKMDCQGSLLWHKVFGGGGSIGDISRSIGIDAENNVYTGMTVWNNGSQPGTPEYAWVEPPHFSDDYVMGTPTEDDSNETSAENKTLALIKYNSNGVFQWLRMPQQNPQKLNQYRGSMDLGIYVGADGTIHWMVGLLAGSHFDGQLMVPEGAPAYRYYVVKYDTEGNYLGSVPAPFEVQYISNKKTCFTYDPNNNRYYFANWRLQQSDSASIIDGIERSNGYVLCFNTEGEIQWIKEGNYIWSVRIGAIKTDENSNLYITGLGQASLLPSDPLPLSKFGDYVFTQQMGIGNMSAAFLMKLNSEGTLLWGTNPTLGGDESALDIALNGNEVAIATGMVNNTWGNYEITDHPANYHTDPVVARFDAETGTCLGLHLILGPAGYREGLTAITTDNNGNYVVGGYMRAYLFANGANAHPVVGLLSKPNLSIGTDFFIARLAKNACGTVSVEEFDTADMVVYPNPTTGIVSFQTDKILTTYEIYGLWGQLVQKGRLWGSDPSLSMENLSAGTYFIKMHTDQGTVITRQVIKR